MRTKSQRRNLRMLALSAGIALTLTACGGPAEQPAPDSLTTQAAPTVPVPPALSINAMMVGLVDDASHEIWDAAVEKTKPRTDEDWFHLQHHATKVTLSGTLITIPGTGQADAAWVTKPEWIKFSKELADAGLAALDAANKKDHAALSAAGDRLVLTCEGCHKVFKGELPSEGLTHQREVH
ncbi:MAG TPA: hypothetical protein VFR18_00305 [Terriglobia bacterium]|nr:hypothetical protein [Terriglobia bacterium]